MANIMLTDICNLRCPYCFANEFVNRAPNEISMENLKTALEFIATDNVPPRVGLIGGEPTLHSSFREILQLLIADDRFKDVVIFTNGVKIDEFVKELSHPKFHLLINCNSPADMGEELYKKMVDNIDLFLGQYYMKDKVTLGINIYQNNFKYDYLLALLKKYKLNHVRMSLVVPNSANSRAFNVQGYFRALKTNFMDFVLTMLKNDIMPTYDCNKMPKCVIEEQDVFKISTLIREKQEERRLKNLPPIQMPVATSSIFTEIVKCSPVVDIRPDLTAIRCFGLSDCTKTDIRDFKSIVDLRNFYLNEVDSYATKVCVAEDCKTCYEHKTSKCYGGCIAYKLAKINKLKEKMKNLLEE